MKIPNGSKLSEPVKSKRIVDRLGLALSWPQVRGQAARCRPRLLVCASGLLSSPDLSYDPHTNQKCVDERLPRSQSDHSPSAWCAQASGRCGNRPTSATSSSRSGGGADLRWRCLVGIASLGLAIGLLCFRGGLQCYGALLVHCCPVCLWGAVSYVARAMRPSVTALFMTPRHR